MVLVVVRGWGVLLTMRSTLWLSLRSWWWDAEPFPMISTPVPRGREARGGAPCMQAGSMLRPATAASLTLALRLRQEGQAGPARASLWACLLWACLPMAYLRGTGRCAGSWASTAPRTSRTQSPSAPIHIHVHPPHHQPQPHSLPALPQPVLGCQPCSAPPGHES